MKDIAFLMEKLGFDKEIFKKGTCFGCATVASQAFVLGEQAYDRYQIRLNRIESLVDQYTKLPTLKHPANSSKVDRLNLEEARFKEILKDLPPPPINYLDKGENEWVSMQAFLENIAIAQEPQLFNREYKIFPNQFINNANPLHFNMIAKLIQSQLAEEQGGFSQVGNFSGVYSAEEMKIVLNSWEQFMNKQEQSRSALIINNRSHCFMLGYDVDHKSWVIDDSSTVRKYDSSFLGDNQTHQLAKDIFSHLPLVQAGIISSSDSEEKIIIGTMVCSTNLSHSKMLQFFADQEWKLLHEVTSEKAKFQSKIGDSWLSLAVQQGRAELVKELITAGSDVNLSVDGATPLFIAVEKNDSQCVKNLLEAKADTNMVSNDGATPLFIAAQNGYVEIFKDLINAGADINISPFTGCTPLYIAAQNGHVEIVKDLINAGADIDTVYTENGYTPLFIAVDNNHTQCVKNLLKAGANPNTMSNAGATPLFMAAQDGHSDIVKDLINVGADITISPFKGCTPLYIAAQNGHEVIVKDLINAGADITISTFEGFTPLYIAAQNGHEVIVKDLINAGADINISAEGYTPLCIAKQKGHIEIIKELEKAAANIDKLSQELTSETKKLTVNKKKDSLSKPELKSEPKSEPKLESKLERQKQLEELLKAPPKSQKTEFNKNSSNAMSTQSRYSFLQTKLQDEKDKDKKKKGEVKLCI